MSKRKVFVGSSQEAVSNGCLKQLVTQLQGALPDVEVVSWKDTIWNNLESALKSLRDALDEFSYAVFLAYPDDLAEIRKRKYYICRDNVIFEFGLFLSSLGTARTFLIAPREEQRIPPAGCGYRILSDIRGVTRAGHYRVRGGKHKLQLAFNLTDVVIHIRRYESKLRVKSAHIAADDLDQRIQNVRVALKARDSSEGFYIGALRSSLEDIVRLKACVTHKSILETVSDMVLGIEELSDLCDINELTRVQTYKNKVTEVWVLADMPLEFIPHGEFDRLRSVIQANLRRNVSYTYFVSPGTKSKVNMKLLVPQALPSYERLREKVTFVVVDERFFKTYFTLHFKGQVLADVYMSALKLSDRKKDLLIRVTDSKHMERIRLCLDYLRGKPSSTDGACHIDFVKPSV